MPFQHGHQKRGGRRRGVPNKVTTDAREIARRLIEDPEYQRRLRERLLKGEASNMEATLWQYAYGKPKDPIEATRDLVSTLQEILAREHWDPRDELGNGHPPRTPVPPASSEDRPESDGRGH